MRISRLTPQKRPYWDQFVQQHPHGLPQHLSGWQDVIQNTYGYQTCYLMAEASEKVVGVLPLFLVNSFIVGRLVRTLPGGLAATCEEAAVSLINAGQSWAKEIAAHKFILADSRKAWRCPGLQTHSNHVFWTTPLCSTQAEMWQALHTNVRRQIRMANRNNLSVQIGRSHTQLALFYALFAVFAHQNGTPLFSQRFLEHIAAAFPHHFNIAVVYEKERPLGAYFQLEMGKTMYGIWGASKREHLKKRPVYLAYWELMRHAIANGFQTLDMGRSPNESNASRYKSQWNGSSFPVYQQIECFNQSINRGREGEKARNFELVRRYWPLLPYPVAHFLGPKLRRHMPFA